MFESLLTRITSPSSRRRYIYNCTPHHTILSNTAVDSGCHSEPENDEDFNITQTPLSSIRPTRNVIERRRIRGKKVQEPGLRQARSLGRLDGLREAERLADYSRNLSGSQPALVDPRSRDLDRIQQLFPQDFLGLHEPDTTYLAKYGNRQRSQITRTYSSPQTPPSTQTRRCFLMEAPCALGPPNSPHAARSRHLFLFSDILIIAKARNATSYKLKEIVRISEIWLSMTPDHDTGFLLGWAGESPRTYLMVHTTHATKDLWWSALQNALSSRLPYEPAFTNVRVTWHDPTTNEECVKIISISPELTASALMRLALPRQLADCGSYNLYCCHGSAGGEMREVMLGGYERPHAIQLARLRQDVSVDEGFDLAHCLSSPNASNCVVFQLRLQTKSVPKKSPLKLFRKSTNRIWGIPLNRLCTNGILPQTILAILRGLLLRGPHTHGIFRRCASIRTVRDLRDKIDRGGVAICEELHLHTNALLLAALLKDFLRNLPEPIITGDIIEWVKSATKADKLRKLIINLPKENNSLLAHIVCVLYHVNKRSDQNQMTAKNLGVCVGPSLMWGLTSSPIKESATIIECLILNCRHVFGPHVVSLLGEPTPDSGAEESDSLHSLVDSVELSRDQKSLSRDSGLTLSEDDRDSPGLLGYNNLLSYLPRRQQNDIEIHHARLLQPEFNNFQRGGWWRQPTRADLILTRPPIYRQPPPVMNKSTECLLIDQSESYV